jgi:Xaa-Pro aminopeptidase
MPVVQFLELRDRLAGLELADGSACIWAIRMVKTEAEIAHIRHICGIACDAYDAVPRLVRKGDSEREAARKVRIELARLGADSTPFLPAISQLQAISSAKP